MTTRTKPRPLIGEQPGDQEDRDGRPFVGPAGRVLHEALDRAGLTDVPTDVTNAVKHFRWEPRGKRRIHRTPGTEHVRACHAWLVEELRLVDPAVVVPLGATAAKSFSKDLRVTQDRGRVVDVDTIGRPTVLTTHPSAVLRSDDRATAMAGLVADLEVAATRLAR